MKTKNKIATILRIGCRLCLLMVWLALMFVFLSPLMKNVLLLRFRASSHEAFLRMKLLRFAIWVIGLRITFVGEKPGQHQRPYVLLANHVSYLDILALGSLLPVRFIAKHDILDWPLLGRLAVWSQSIFVDRSHVLTRVRALRSIRKAIHKDPICIFPEGTTTSAEAPASCFWHRGSAALAVSDCGGFPFYVAGLHYQLQETAAWVDDQSLLPHLIRLLGQPKRDLFIVMERLPLHDRPEGLATRSELTWKRCRALCDQAKLMATG